ncbi:spermatogenesis-associated protein 7 homolog [Schistocerca piceifrons]|uniref:spermatogenesis-associated protein 7 homolog n=1 Tax=Schistocerca piceifrons TaxID=274613 RepID=UPI001F5F3D7D|nr:spermatogenesis-associated protein 7 homolog [Schistocerca piceifrons]
MKCFTRVKSNVFAPTSTDIISQNMIYWQMSKHYKRIKSARKVVDTSAPSHSKFSSASTRRGKKSSTECHSSLSSDGSLRQGFHCSSETTDSALTHTCEKYNPGPISGREQQEERPVPNAKCRRPTKSCKHNTQSTISLQCNVKCCHNSITKSKTCYKTSERNSINIHKKEKSSFDIMEVHSKDFISPSKPFKPRILKTDAEPRIRNLRVYYPPRKKVHHKRVMTDVKENDFAEADEERCEVVDQISTQTSAYSADSDSQSNWNADQEVQFLPNYTFRKGKGKVASELSSCDSAYNGGISSAGESRGSSPEQNRSHTLNTDLRTNQESDISIIRRNEDEINDATLQFTNDIVNTIIKNNTLSNSGIKNIIKLCMSEYEGKLDKVKMIQEVKKLMEQLDVEDEDVYEEKFLEKEPPYRSFVRDKNCKNTNVPKCNVVINSITGKTSPEETGICDPFDDDLLLQEYRSELRKLDIDPENYFFPLSSGVEMAVEYMCAYPFTANTTSQDILEEELWLHPFKIDFSLDTECKNSKLQSQVECDQDGLTDEQLGKFSCVNDPDNISSSSTGNSSRYLIRNNSDCQLQDIEHLMDLQLGHQTALTSINKNSECSQILCLSEMVTECKLSDV